MQNNPAKHKKTHIYTLTHPQKTLPTHQIEETNNESIQVRVL